MQRSIARRYRYEGQVQGVGFRRITETVASTFKVTGYVMNLSDGRVELHAEGPMEEIDRFVQEIDRKFESKITRVTQELVDPRKYNRFSVAFERESREVM
jgi:acylphosphatase